MSDPHDHQPDPAALDELQRAFGDETASPSAPAGPADESSAGAESSAGDEPDVGSGAPAVADGVGLAGRHDASSDGERGGGESGGERGGGERGGGERGVGERGVGERGGGERGVGERGDGQRGDGERGDGERGDGQRGDGETDERRREVLTALGIDDDLESEFGDDRDRNEPEEILIVEQEPLVDPTPTPPPAIIRIDDYGGGVAVDAPTPEQPDSAPALDVAPADDAVPDDVSPAVITIDDSDIPDAVRVEGDLDGTGDRTTVFIDDDETGDAIAPEIDRDVRRGIEPRLRERRAAVKRALGRKRLRWVLAGTLVVLIGVGVLAVLGSGLFAIKEDQVTVTGVVYAESSEVDAVIDDLVGTPALLVDVQAAEDELEAIPWVDDARVRVSFPHTVTIEIRERAAMTTYQGPDQRYRVLDRDGRVLAVLEGWPIAYVLVTGPDPVDLEAGQFAPQGYAAASELAKNLTDSIRGQVERIDVSADGARLIVFLDDGTEVRFGAARDLFNKLLRLETTLANNPDREPGVIDVSTSEVTL